MRPNKGDKDKDHDKGDMDHGKGDNKENRAEKFEAMAKELNLTADQSAKFKTLQTSLRAKIKDIKSNTTLTEEQTKSEMKEVFKTHKKSVDEILTTEQRKQMKDKFKKHKHEGEE
jgi:Spy/CpxP family protein refolding chaperone